MAPDGAFFVMDRRLVSMDALVYTRDDRQYGMFSRIFVEEFPKAAVTRGILDGHMHMEKEYDVVVVDMDGAEGMEFVCKYREVYGDTLVVWITDDRYFAGVAIRLHIFDFIIRPFEEARFRESLKRIKDGDIEAWQRGAVKNSIYQIGCIHVMDRVRTDGSGQGKIPLRTGKGAVTIWTKIRDYFLSENTL